jgi:hypothetical protein
MNTHLSFSLARSLALRCSQHKNPCSSSGEREEKETLKCIKQNQGEARCTCSRPAAEMHIADAALAQSNYPDCTSRSMPLWKLNGISKVNKWKMAHVVQIQIYAKVFKIQTH